jgi:hypothetical protein
MDQILRKIMPKTTFLLYDCLKSKKNVNEALSHQSTEAGAF